MILTQIKTKILSLGGMNIPEFLTNEKDQEFDINMYLRKKELELEPVFIQFLSEYGYHSFMEDVLFYSSEILPVSQNHYCSLGIFFGWGKDKYSLSSVNENIYDQIPNQLFVFAEGAAGDYLCVGGKGDQKGKIYYWCHDIPEDEKKVFMVADNFEEFISKLIRELPNGKDLGIVSEWFDDDF